MNNIISVQNITKVYKNDKGIFNVNFEVVPHTIFGFLGPNGAGKTTTIRHIMGYVKADSGKVLINDINMWDHPNKLQSKIGYLPGEISFFDEMTGKQFIHFITKYRRIENPKAIDELLKRFELDLRGKIKNMSKGMKQKIGIVCAFMHDPQFLILDEPTSGLDPLMQNRFVELILEEKQKGKTILMSSHMFEEIERTCDQIAIIKNGKIIENNSIEHIRAKQQKVFIVKFVTPQAAYLFHQTLSNKNILSEIKQNILNITINGDFPLFFNLLSISAESILDFDIKHQTLEERFLSYYGEEQN